MIDEFHHAAAPTYRRIIEHFRPQFLLGLTATPERMDGADLLALCGDNLVFECGLVEGISRGELCRFEYRAERDVADFAHVPWRNGRFDPEALAGAIETIRPSWAGARGLAPARKDADACVLLLDHACGVHVGVLQRA